MKLNKKIILAGIIIIILLVAGCTSTKAQKQNTNFNVIWSERYDDVDQEPGYRIFTKIDIPQDNRECYIAKVTQGVALTCYDKKV